MVLKIFTIVVLIALSGCGGTDTSGVQSFPCGDARNPGNFDPAKDNHGCGWHFDAQGVSGLRVRYSPIFESPSVFATVGYYEFFFDKVQTCTSIQAPGPFIIVVPRGTLPIDANGGRYLKNPSLILIEDLAPLQHEMVHYLVDYSTDDPDLFHKSPFFKTCIS